MVPRQKRSQQESVADLHPLLLDQAAFDAALAALVATDRELFATLLADCPSVGLRRREPGFEGLVAIIVAQQVSTASANAIFGRVKVRFPTLSALDVLAASDEDLKGCGLSAPKIRTIRVIAEAVASGMLDFDALGALEAEAAHTTLVALKGIGPWTADVFLLFCLGHADAWPAGDLALQEAARAALDLPTRPTTQELVALGERWRPWRGVAAHCLWAYYGAARKRATTLEDAAARAKPRTRLKKRMG